MTQTFVILGVVVAVAALIAVVAYRRLRKEANSQ
jgi:hypothetical protein